MRIDNRANTDLRKLKITRGFVGTADGSVLIEMGNTRVICTASIEEKVPQFLKDQKKDGLPQSIQCCRSRLIQG